MQLSRRGFPRYDHNPSLAEATQAMQVGMRRITNRAGDKCMIVSEAGEIVAPAGFHEVVEVDKTRFVKLYISGVKALQSLTSSGARVFELIYGVVSENPKNDRLTLHHEYFKETISLATWKRGITELIAKEFLYESTVPHTYWLNVNYIFNGNRLAFIKEYRLRRDNGNANQLGLFD